MMRDDGTAGAVERIAQQAGGTLGDDGEPPRVEDEDSAPVMRCAEEASRFLQGQPTDARHGFALFQRALVARDERAWEAIHTCYAPLVSSWAIRLTTDRRAVDSLVVAAFERLWHAVDAAKFTHFPDLRRVLQYLKLCVTAAELDRRRSLERGAARVELQAAEVWGCGDAVASGDGAGRQALDAAARQAFWRAIRRQCHSYQELLVIRLSFVEGLRPREICRRAPAQFPTVQDVYRVKRNVLQRLRHSGIVQELAM